ncbi:MAG: ABC transporter permease, partial [bacterium]
LLGLVSLAVSRRTKEIGVRKVLGASVTNILTLLTGDFVKLVVISNFVAWPAIWFAMSHWLQNFAYRIGLGWWMFGMIGALALLIAIFTVGAQAMRAALANPVKALRYE